MKQTWKITVWGVRGSFPVPDRKYMGYGGNTSCISVDCGGRFLILDAGSGLIELGNRLSARGQKRADILLSHLHLDHCLGLFGFRLFHDPEAEVHLYGRSHDGRSLEENLKRLIGPPCWPLGLKDFPARIRIHEIRPGESFRPAGDENLPGGLSIGTMAGNHPNQSIYYRLEQGDKCVVYALDCELTEEFRKSLTEFARDAALLIWDASFTEEDLTRYRGWGHSSWKPGACLGRDAHVKRVLMTHYASGYTDAFLEEQEKLAAESEPLCLFAREGMELVL